MIIIIYNIYIYIYIYALSESPPHSSLLSQLSWLKPHQASFPAIWVLPPQYLLHKSRNDHHAKEYQNALRPPVINTSGSFFGSRLDLLLMEDILHHLGS